MLTSSEELNIVSTPRQVRISFHTIHMMSLVPLNFSIPQKLITFCRRPFPANPLSAISYIISFVFPSITNCFSTQAAIIMYQHAIRANIIGMIILNLKVVDGDRCFQNLVLGLFQRDILAIDQHQNISGAEVYCGIPSLMRHIEGMGGFCVPPGAPRIPRGSFLVALQRQLH